MPQRGSSSQAKLNSGGAATVRWRTLGGDANRAGASRAGRFTGPGGVAAGTQVDLRRRAERVDEVGRLLQSAFGAILAGLPPRVVRVADVARCLDLDRSICQRVVLGVRDATDGLGVLERFPGVRGLEQFIAAAEGRGCPQEVTREARRALEAYADLVSESGGSQTRLVGHIESLRAHRRAGARTAAPAGAEVEAFRRMCYDGAVGVTGLASSARVELVIVGPGVDGTAGQITTVGATGMIGIEAAPYAMPLTRRSRLPGLRPVPEETPVGAAPQVGGLTPDLLLRPFTSEPPPSVTTRTEGEYLIQIFNSSPGTASAPAPLDVVAAMAFSWTWEDPTSPDANYYSVGRIIGPPARRLIFDVYLHRSLPPPTGVSAHVLRPGMQGSLGDARPSSRWFDRIPLEHDLVLLGGAPGDRPADAYPRLGELTRHLLDTMRWRDEPFTGYRLDVTYPIFDFEYVIAAEF